MKNRDYLHENDISVDNKNKKTRNLKPQFTFGRITDIDKLIKMSKEGRIPREKLININYKYINNRMTFIDPGSTDSITNRKFYDKYLNKLTLHKRKRPIYVTNAGDKQFTLSVSGPTL